MPASYAEICLLIDGEWISAKGRTSSPVVNPATGEVIGQVPHATQADLQRAIESTERGFKVWRNTPAYERAKILRKASALLRERSESIAQKLTMEQGKPLFEARYELNSSADYFE